MKERAWDKKGNIKEMGGAVEGALQNCIFCIVKKIVNISYTNSLYIKLF